MYFIDTTSQLIYDHLNRTGIPSAELRPNQIIRVSTWQSRNRSDNQWSATVLSKLVYEHGTTTLAQSDSNFHPFHEYPPYYVKDAAYHNARYGTWLNGAAIYAATRYDLQDVIYPSRRIPSIRCCIAELLGALSELLDCTPSFHYRARLSGTYSQAWSLAEFIRSMYQDYFGISVDIPSKAIRIQPKLPAELSSVEFEQRIGTASAKISYRRSNEKVIITDHSKKFKRTFRVNYLWVYPNGDAVVFAG